MPFPIRLLFLAWFNSWHFGFAFLYCADITCVTVILNWLFWYSSRSGLNSWQFFIVILFLFIGMLWWGIMFFRWRFFNFFWASSLFRNALFDTRKLIRIILIGLFVLRLNSWWLLLLLCWPYLWLINLIILLNIVLL